MKGLVFGRVRSLFLRAVSPTAAEGGGRAVVARRLAAFFTFTLAGLLVFLVAGYWAGTPAAVRVGSRIALPVLFLLAVVGSGRLHSLRRFRTVLAAFLAASSAFLVAHWTSGPLSGILGARMDSAAGLALAKLADAIPIVVTILVVARWAGLGPADLLLRRGSLRAWFVVGLVSLGSFLALFVLQALDLGIGPRRLLELLPWILLFAASNAFMEELHFRGLLLRPLEPFLGSGGANLCIALFFTLSHAPVGYAPDMAVFLPLLFLLALAWGYVIQKTGALWGAVLFHAGADLAVIFGIYGSYGVELGVATPG